MNLNEVIASNVRRIREARGLSVAEFADELGVGKHRVYDYERPRKGAQQRQFLWEEIVQLCTALDVTIFELVLPEEGERAHSEYIESLNLNIDKYLRAASDEVRDWRRPDDRGLMMEILFGIRFDPKDIDKLIDMRRDRIKRLRDELVTLLKEDE